jgi:hypothetical protein
MISLSAYRACRALDDRDVPSFDTRINMFHEVCLYGVGRVIWKGRKPLGRGQYKILVAHSRHSSTCPTRRVQGMSGSHVISVTYINYHRDPGTLP